MNSSFSIWEYVNWCFIKWFSLVQFQHASFSSNEKYGTHHNMEFSRANVHKWVNLLTAIFCYNIGRSGRALRSRHLRAKVIKNGLDTLCMHDSMHQLTFEHLITEIDKNRLRPLRTILIRSGGNYVPFASIGNYNIQ